MADQSGLRFDIYERIRLPDDAVGIQELEEIELTPHIRVHAGTRQSILKGSLRLSGRYIGVGEPGQSRQMQFEIPVEISLPEGRGLDMREVGAEIENFDVDVISQRSLNVTGVLSLRGFKLPRQNGDSSADDEEMIFVHHAADQAVQNENEDTVERKKPVKEEKPSSSQPQPDFVYPEPNWMPEFAPPADNSEPDWQENEAVEQENNDNDNDNDSDGDDMQEQLNPFYNEQEEDQEDIGPFAQEIESVSREPQSAKEVKVAFSGKKLDDDGYEPINLAGALSQTQGDLQAVNASVSGQQAHNGEAPSEAKSGSQDALEWKKLFLNKTQEEEFRSVRMCIVQKEETVDLIAERYQINPREIVLYNRLDGESLTEGQVIYIPKSS